MKRKVLFALWLVAWTLFCCTVFSIKIEKLTRVRVVTAARPTFGAAVLPLESALRDDAGWHLYYTYEGSGWESGTRVAELGSGSFTVYDDPEAVDETTGAKIRPHVEASAPWEGRVIEYFSHPPRAGEAAEDLDPRERGEDTWLVLSALPLPEALTLSSGLELAAQDGGSLLLTVRDEAKPFLESEARARLADTPELAGLITPTARDELRVYSLDDAETLWSAVPRLALILVLALAPVFLALPMFLARSGRRVIAVINGLLIVLAAVGIWRLTKGVALPASLLPEQMIFDLRHYAAALGQILRSLEAFTDERAALALSGYAAARRGGLAVLCIGGALTLVLCALEALICFRKKKS